MPRTQDNRRRRRRYRVTDRLWTVLWVALLIATNVMLWKGVIR